MERFFKPAIFDTDPSSPTAAKEWLHWKRTFTNFIEMLPTQIFLLHLSTTNNSDPKMLLLTNFISHNVYDIISECATFVGSMSALEAAYIKPKNEIFSRHLLATRQQKTGETIDQFLHSLRQLAKDCTFTLVTPDQYKEEYIRDAFINGLRSNIIRQRLLENQNLTLDAAFDQARALDSAQKSSESYKDIPPCNANISSTNEINTDGALAGTSSTKNKHMNNQTIPKQMCYFCGNQRHPRSHCPAR